MATRDSENNTRGSHSLPSGPGAPGGHGGVGGKERVCGPCDGCFLNFLFSRSRHPQGERPASRPPHHGMPGGSWLSSSPAHHSTPRPLPRHLVMVEHGGPEVPPHLPNSHATQPLPTRSSRSPPPLALPFQRSLNSEHLLYTRL